MYTFVFVGWGFIFVCVSFLRGKRLKIKKLKNPTIKKVPNVASKS